MAIMWIRKVIGKIQNDGCLKQFMQFLLLRPIWVYNSLFCPKSTIWYKTANEWRILFESAEQSYTEYPRPMRVLTHPRTYLTVVTTLKIPRSPSVLCDERMHVRKTRTQSNDERLSILPSSKAHPSMISFHVIYIISNHPTAIYL